MEKRMERRIFVKGRVAIVVVTAIVVEEASLDTSSSSAAWNFIYGLRASHTWNAYTRDTLTTRG